MDKHSEGYYNLSKDIGPPLRRFKNIHSEVFHVMKVLVINPGAISTKIAVFDEENEIFKKTIEHTMEDLAPFESIIDQHEYRKNIILQVLAENGYAMSDFQAVCGRGGLLRHIPSGTYIVNDRVVADIEAAAFGEHASNLGALLAKELGDTVGIPSFFVDPVSTDELTDIARVTGLKGMVRESFFHALNHKSMARKAAEQLGKAYEDVSLIVVHMGSGVSVGAHQRGRVIDNYNVRDEGAFALDRCGSIPSNQLIELCYLGMAKQEVRKLITREGGVLSYLGTRDFREVENRMFSGDAEAKLIAEAMIYQLCKDMGAMAAVLRYDVDAIVLTGGMAHSKWVCNEIEGYMGKLCPILVLPGEEEVRSLAEGAFRVLHGEPARTY